MAADIEFRSVEDADAKALAHLVRGIPFERPIDEVFRSMAHVATRVSDPAIIASDDGRIVGLVAIHIMPPLFYREPVARVTALIVDESERRRGIGRLLIEVASSLAFQGGCNVIELTAELERADCRAFYNAAGFLQSSIQLTRKIL